MNVLERQEANARRDALECKCGHRNVAHAYSNGVGNGPCGIDRDTRNALTGWLGDPCPCESFSARVAFGGGR